jgi:hypothetical protein
MPYCGTDDAHPSLVHCRLGIDGKSSRDCVDARLMFITRASAIEGYGMLKYKGYMSSDRGKEI